MLYSTLNLILKKMEQNVFNLLKPEYTIVIFIHYKPRIVVDEDDLKWVANCKKILLLLNSSTCIFVLIRLDFRKVIHSSEMQNNALMHREGL